MRLHGGTIQAFSEGEGKGSTFVYRIPMKKCTQTDSEYAMDEKMNEDEIRPALPSAMVSDFPQPLIPMSRRDGGRFHRNPQGSSAASAASSNESRNMAARCLSSSRLQLLSHSQRGEGRRQGEGRRSSSLSADIPIQHVVSSRIFSSGIMSRDESSAGDLPPVCLLS